MKKHVVRTPETDRYKLNVPTLLTDLEDYDETLCSGSAHATNFSTGGGGSDILVDPMTVEADAVNCVDVAGAGLSPQVDGLFIISIRSSWTEVVGGTDLNNRSTLLWLNGSAQGTCVNAPFASLGGSGPFEDAGTFIVRLSAGDQVQVALSEEVGGSEAEVDVVLSIAKIAP